MAVSLQDYSTLEVPDQDVLHRGTSRSEPESSGSSFDDEKFIFSGDSEKQVGAQPGNLDTPESEGLQPRQLIDDGEGSLNTSNQRVRRKWLAGGLAICLMMVVVTIVGAVLGLRSKSNSTSEGHTPTIKSNDSIDVAQAAPNSTIESSSPRRIAALSFCSQRDTSDGVQWTNQTRVYYQDKKGELIEGSVSSVNSTWGARHLGIFPRNGSAIAAAVARPSNKRMISLLYLDEDFILHDHIFTGAIPGAGMVGNWAPGKLVDEKLKVLPSSGLAVLYAQCENCSNTTIIAFQDKNGFIQTGNSSLDGTWSLNQLNNLEPYEGTDLTLIPRPWPQGLMEIDLFYQKKTLNISYASWKPARDNKTAWWNPSDQTYVRHSEIPGTPLSASSSDHSTTTGLVRWIQMLWPSPKGLIVSSWSGNTGNWIGRYANPSVMSNSTFNPVEYGAVAATANGEVFSVIKEGAKEKLRGWKMADDTLNWEDMGDVDLYGAWDSGLSSRD